MTWEPRWVLGDFSGPKVCAFTREAGKLALGVHPFFSAGRWVEAGWPWKVSWTETEEEEPETPRYSRRAEPSSPSERHRGQQGLHVCGEV